MLDTAVNFARGTVSAITATTVTYTKTGAQDFPSPSGSPNPDIGYNVVIWDATDYASPDLDPNAMIFRVTGWASGTLTGYWVGQNEADSQQGAPTLTAGKTYTIIMGPTAKTVRDAGINNFIPETPDFLALGGWINTAWRYGQYVGGGWSGTGFSSDGNFGRRQYYATGTTINTYSCFTFGNSYGGSSSYTIMFGPLYSGTDLYYYNDFETALNAWNVSQTTHAVLYILGWVADSGDDYSILANPTAFQTAGAGEGIFFRYDTSEASNPGNWKCVVKNGANAETEVDSGVAVTASRVKFRIICSTTEAFFFINGALVARIGTGGTASANFPTSTYSASPVIMVENLAAQSEGYDISFFRAKGPSVI